MKGVLFALGVAGAAAIAAVAAASGAWLFWEAISASDPQSFRTLISAFSGAFFAFLFVRLGEGLKRIYERKEKHHSSLVRLEHYFNECLNITGDNLFVVDTWESVFDERRLEAGERPIFINLFHQYPIDREVPLGLTNLDFLNEVFTLNVELRKLNDSMATADRSYAQVMNAFVGKQIDQATYLANIRHSRGRYVEIREFLEEAKQDLIRLLATEQLLSGEAPFLVRVIRALTRSKYSPGFRRRVEEEMLRVRSEIDMNEKASQGRIDRVQSRVAQPGAAADAPQAARR